MRKILISLVTIGVVGTLGYFGASRAFFSDTETSTGNTFVAGAIDLKIDSTAHYAGLVCTPADGGPTWQEEVTGQSTRPDLIGQPCDGTWDLADLSAENIFYNLSDLKPGDSGENTISIHVDSNPSWLCADVDLTENNENSATEPEIEDGDSADIPEDQFDGELAQRLRFTAWQDDGDNIWENGEQLLFSNVEGPASDVLGGKTYALADSITGVPFPGGNTTSYIGLQWCFGNMVVDQGDHTISCDGSNEGNSTQTDSVVANIAFRAIQSRNNPNFVCARPQQS